MLIYLFIGKFAVIYLFCTLLYFGTIFIIAHLSKSGSERIY